MRYFIVIFTVFFSHFLNGQNVPDQFLYLEYKTGFESSDNHWIQSNTTIKKYVLIDEHYKCKNVNETNFDFNLYKPTQSVTNFQIISGFKIIPNPKKETQVGLVFLADVKQGKAYTFEINSKKKFRIRSFYGGQWTNISNNENDGWIKIKNWKKKQDNQYIIRTDGFYVDVLINNKLEHSFSSKWNSGNYGFYLSPQAEMDIDYISQFTSIKPKNENETQNTKDTSTTSEAVINTNNDTYSTVINLLKTKIEKQQMAIEELELQLKNCQSKAEDNKSTELLQKELDEAYIAKGKLELEFEAYKNTNSEMGLLRKYFEKNPNADIIIELTELLNKEKEKNNKLELEIKQLNKKE